MPKEKSGYFLRVSKTGRLQIPEPLCRVMGVSILGGGYLWAERTGRYEIRLTPSGRRDWESIPEEERRKDKREAEESKEADRRAEKDEEPATYIGLGGPEIFVREVLEFRAGAQIPTREVQERYVAWTEAYKGGVWGTNAAHLGRAIKKMLPGVKRGRLKGSSSDQFISAYHNLAFRPSTGEGPDIPIVITEDEPNGEPPTVVTDDQLEG